MKMNIGPSDAYDELYDLPPWDGLPKRQYLVASVPRSGSTYITSLIAKDGRFGLPLEYFNFSGVKRMRSRLSSDIISYVRELFSIRTSSVGIFGSKVFISDMVNLSENHSKVFDLLQPDCFVYIKRRDIVGQAVSYYLASVTGDWFHSTEERSIIYSFEGIGEKYRSILRQYEAWDMCFSRMNLTPHEIWYEDVLVEPESIFTSMSVWMDVENLEVEKGRLVPQPRRQGGEKNLIWADRFVKSGGPQIYS